MAGSAAADRRHRSLGAAIALSIAVHAGAAVLNIGSGKARDPAVEPARAMPLRLVDAARPAPAQAPVVARTEPRPPPKSAVAQRVKPHAHPHPQSHVHARHAEPALPSSRSIANSAPASRLPQAEADVTNLPHGPQPLVSSAPRDANRSEPAPAAPPANAAPAIVTSGVQPDAQAIQSDQPAEKAAPIVTAAVAAPARASADDDRIEPPHYNVAYLNNPKPDYPAAARRLRLQGEVIVRAMVDPAGRAGDLKIQRSSGTGLLDEAALRAVRDYRFVPARRGSEAVTHWVDVPFTFRLSD